MPIGMAMRSHFASFFALPLVLQHDGPEVTGVGQGEVAPVVVEGPQLLPRHVPAEHALRENHVGARREVAGDVLRLAVSTRGAQAAPRLSHGYFVIARCYSSKLSM